MEHLKCDHIKQLITLTSDSIKRAFLVDDTALKPDVATNLQSALTQPQRILIGVRH